MFNTLYKKCLNLAAHKSSKYYLALVSFIESSFFPVPPDVMIIPMVISKKNDFIKIFITATIFSVLGGILGYLIGFLLFNSIGILLINFYHLNEQITQFQNYYNNYGVWIVIIAGFTPFPFKLITIASGLFQLNFFVFVLCSFLVSFRVPFCSLLETSKTILEPQHGPNLGSFWDYAGNFLEYFWSSPRTNNHYGITSKSHF